jgi:hypothetical protein
LRTLGRTQREKTGPQATGRATNMFATRDDYQMSEEDYIEYERQENQEEQQRKKKKSPNSSLG